MISTEVSPPTLECPHPELWSMFDDNSAEVEVVHFLYDLIKLIKPKLVVETGTHIAISAGYMASAISSNGFGKLVTCETQECYHKGIEQKLAPLSLWVDFRKCSSLELDIREPIDILFSDSDPRIRMREVGHLWNRLTPTSLILIHDVNSGGHNELRREVLSWEKECDKILSVVMLPTPRGLAICQKRHGR